MPGELQLMGLFPLQHIAYQPESAMDMENKPPMKDGIFQTTITRVAARKECERNACDPVFRVDVWERAPGKRTFRDGLITPVHANSIVRGSAPKEIPLIVFTDVAKRAR